MCIQNLKNKMQSACTGYANKKNRKLPICINKANRKRKLPAWTYKKKEEKKFLLVLYNMSMYIPVSLFILVLYICTYWQWWAMLQL